MKQVATTTTLFCPSKAIFETTHFFLQVPQFTHTHTFLRLQPSVAFSRGLPAPRRVPRARASLVARWGERVCEQ